jgi:hypothetical protein
MFNSDEQIVDTTEVVSGEGIRPLLFDDDTERTEFTYTQDKGFSVRGTDEYIASVYTGKLVENLPTDENNVPSGGDENYVTRTATLQNLVPAMPWQTVDESAALDYDYNDNFDDVYYTLDSKTKVVMNGGTGVGQNLVIPVKPSTAYTFKCRVEIGDGGAGTDTYTTNLYSSSPDNDLIAQDTTTFPGGTGLSRITTLSFTTPSYCNAIIIDLTNTTGNEPASYSGVVLTEDAAGTPTTYLAAYLEGTPNFFAVGLNTAAGNYLQEWSGGVFVATADNEPGLVVNVGASDSSLPYIETSAWDNLIATFTWTNDPVEQKQQMEVLITTLEEELAKYLDMMKIIVQVNKPTKPILLDWIAAYRKAGGEGDLPEDASYRWSDSSQATKEYTSDFIIFPGKNGDAPLSENGRHLTGATTRLFLPIVETDIDLATITVSDTLVNGGKAEMKEMWMRRNYTSSTTTQADPAYSQTYYSGAAGDGDSGFIEQAWQLTYHTSLVGGGSDIFRYIPHTMKYHIGNLNAGSVRFTVGLEGEGRAFPAGTTFSKQRHYCHYESRIYQNIQNQDTTVEYWPRAEPVPLSLVEIYHV